MLSLLISIFWGIVGGLLAWRLRVPGGAAVGAMAACMLYNIVQTQPAQVPTWFSLAAQIAVGVTVGSTANRELFQNGFGIFAWALIGAICYLLLGLLLAIVSNRLGHIPFATGLFGFSPGGFTNMSIIAGEEGADAARVTLIHFTRVVLLFIIVPWLVRLLVSR